MSKFVSNEEIINLHSYHPPKDENIVRAHELVRTMCRSMSITFNDLLAESPQKTHLLRQVLPEIMMRANQVVACHGIDQSFFEEEVDDSRAQKIRDGLAPNWRPTEEG